MGQTLEFEVNKPVEVALKYGEGKIFPGNWGSRVMYSLDLPVGHTMFLDMDVAQKVNLLEPSVGETFVICKRGSKRFDLWLTPDSEKARAARESGVPVKGNGRPDWGADRRPAAAGKTTAAAIAPHAPAAAVPAAVARPAQSENASDKANGSALAEALKTAVGAAHAATEHARKTGYAGMPQFTGADISRMAIALMGVRQ
jgi:hypothetical protein